MVPFLRLARSIVGSFVAACIAFGCGGDDETSETPAEVCGRVAVAACNRIFACTTEAERTLILGIPGLTSVDCKLYLATNAKCSAEATAEKVCAGANPYPISQAEACIVEANTVTCDKVKANTTNFAAYVPACVQCLPKL